MNAVLHGPRGNDLRGTGEGRRIAALKVLAGAWGEVSRLNLPPESPAWCFRLNPDVLGEKGRGGAARPRLVDGRREAVEVGARPPSRAFWRCFEGRWSKERGGAMGRSGGRLQRADGTDL